MLAPKSVKCYLVQVPLGVPQEGDGMSRPHIDGHRCQPGGRAVQYGLRFHSDPAGHGAGGVVGAAGVGVQGVLTGERNEDMMKSQGEFQNADGRTHGV